MELNCTYASAINLELNWDAPQQLDWTIEFEIYFIVFSCDAWIYSQYKNYISPVPT